MLPCRAKLKNEKQQLVDTVEALSKRVQRLEESTGTVVKQPPTSAEHPSSTVSSSAPGLVTCATAAAAAATTPEYSPFADIAGVAPKQCSPSTSNLTGMPSDALHDVHRLFTVNYNTQSASSSITTSSSHTCSIKVDALSSKISRSSCADFVLRSGTAHCICSVKVIYAARWSPCHEAEHRADKARISFADAVRS